MCPKKKIQYFHSTVIANRQCSNAFIDWNIFGCLVVAGMGVLSWFFGLALLSIILVGGGQEVFSEESLQWVSSAPNCTLGPLRMICYTCNPGAMVHWDSFKVVFKGKDVNFTCLSEIPKLKVGGGLTLF